MLQRKHIAVDEIQVTTIFSGDPVHIFEFPDIIGGHPAVLAGGGVTTHPAGVITAEQTFEIELYKVSSLLLICQQSPGDGLFPADDPGIESVFHKLQGLLLDIRKARLFQIPDHMWRNTENASYLIDLKFAGLQELRLFGGNGDRCIFHALLEHGDLAAIGTAAKL